MNIQTEISVYQNPACRALDFYVSRFDPHTREAWIADPLVLRPVKAFELASTPTFQIDERRAPQDSVVLQSLIDQLWNMGVRPRNAKAGDAQIEAMQRHLQDMRHLAFKGQPPKNEI